MIQEEYAAWPATMRRQLGEAEAAQAPAVAQRDLSDFLCQSLEAALTGFLDGADLPASRRLDTATEAIALLLVRAAEDLPIDRPVITRLESLLTRVSQRAWALQLARHIPDAPRNGAAS